MVQTFALFFKLFSKHAHHIKKRQISLHPSLLNYRSKKCKQKKLRTFTKKLKTNHLTFYDFILKRPDQHKKEKKSEKSKKKRCRSLQFRPGAAEVRPHRQPEVTNKIKTIFQKEVLSNCWPQDLLKQFQVRNDIRTHFF